jgi:hypothetical protein
MRERRIAKRVDTLRRATLVSSRLSSSLDCSLRDLSATGARLLVDGDAAVPDEFVLVLDHRRLSCRVAWRAKRQVGVRFVVEAIGDLAGARLG